MGSPAFRQWMEQPGPQFQDEDDIAWSAWQASRAQALREAYDLMFDIKGCKAARFDAQTAIRILKDQPCPPQ